MLFVSHDRYFLDQVATRVLVLENGKCTQYEGNYSDYLHFVRATRSEGAAIATPGTAADPRGGRGDVRRSDTTANAAGSTSASVRQEQPDDKSTGRRRRKFPYRKVEDLESEISGVESRIEQLRTDMLDPAVLRDGDRIRQTTREHDERQTQLAQLIEHWEEACELN